MVRNSRQPLCGLQRSAADIWVLIVIQEGLTGTKDTDKEIDLQGWHQRGIGEDDSQQVGKDTIQEIGVDRWGWD